MPSARDRSTTCTTLHPPRGRRRARALVVLVLLATPACRGEPPAAPETLPRDGTWFWRDVLSRPWSDDEAPAREDVLALPTPVEVADELVALRAARDPAALATLQVALRDPREGIAVLAARGLGLLGDPAAIPRLLKALGPHPVDYDVPPEVRAAAASALAVLGNPAGIPLVLTMLAEGTDDEVPRAQLPWEPTTRMAFIQELALPALQALAGQDFGFEPNDPVPERLSAVRAARAWWDEHRLRLWAATAPLADDAGLAARVRLLVHNLRAYQLRQIDGARFTLTHLGPGVLPFLEEGLASDDLYSRVHVLEVLEGLAALCDRKDRGRLAVVAAGPLLQDPSVEVAAQAAAVCGAAGVGDMLVNALQRRPEPALRVAVVDALARTALPAMAPVLDAWWRDLPPAEHTPDLVAAVEGARLALDPSRAPDGLLQLLASPDPGTAYPALERLLRLTGSDHGVDPLQPPADREAALQSARLALLQLGPSRAGG